jgi:hypothetical protein
VPWQPLDERLRSPWLKGRLSGIRTVLCNEQIIHGEARITGSLHAQLQGLDPHPQFYKKVHHVMALLHEDLLVDSRLADLNHGSLKCIARGI